MTFRTLLRFFNLLEPDIPYMSLSLSKLSVWLTLGLTVYVVGMGKGPQEVAGALLANIGSMGNYAYRRRLQVRTGTAGYRDGGCPDDDDGMNGGFGGGNFGGNNFGGGGGGNNSPTDLSAGINTMTTMEEEPR